MLYGLMRLCLKLVSSIKTYVVDIGQRVCYCRKLNVIGIPCVHGVTTIISNKSKSEDFVNEDYYYSTFTKTYNRMIIPIPIQTMWLQTNYDKIMPHPPRKRVGRLKKNMKKAKNEPKNPIRVRKHYTSLRCGKCKEVGHNSKTCNELSTSVSKDRSHKIP